MVKRLWGKYQSIPVQLRASLWFLICSFLQKGISVIVTPIFTRLMTTAEYGNYEAFNSWLGIITIFVTLHLYSGVYAQGVVKFEEDRKKFSSSTQGLLFALLLLWTGVYFAFRNFWNGLFDLTTVQMLAMLVTIWATEVFNLWATEQRVTFSYRKLVLITLLVSLAKPAVGIFFVTHWDDKVTARVLAVALVELIGYTGLCVAQIVRGKKLFSGHYWKYAILFSLPLIPHYLSQVVLNSSDKIMIKELVGSEKAGIYGLAYKISQIMFLFNTALLQTITPWIYQKIKADKTEQIAKVGYTALIGIAGLNIFLIALAPEVVKIFAPSDYYNAIWVIPPVAMSVFFMFMYSLFSNFEFYFEKTKLIMIASVICAAMNVGLNYVFIRLYDYYAAGYTTLFCYIAYAFFHYLMMRVICKKHLPGRKTYNGKFLLLLSVIFVGIGGALLATYKFPIIRYSIVGVLLLVVIILHKQILAKCKELFRIRKEKTAKKATVPAGEEPTEDSGKKE